MLVGLALIGLLLELILRDDINNPMSAAPVSIAMAISLIWRRTHPLTVVACTFGTVFVYDMISIVFGFGALNVYMPAVMLIAMYAVFRWGSGRDMAIAFVLGIAVFIIANVLDYTGVGDTVGGFFILQFGPVLALAIRYVGRSREQAREQIRVSERERIARELHDTVAHHVSAIAIQAQAGRFVAENGSIEGASQALEVIEEEASRTLTEMRTIVGALRDSGSQLETAPQSGIADVRSFASTTSTPEVVVQIDDEAIDVSPAIGAAVYRIAQESITNARRHARNATRVNVLVQALHGDVQLTVTDDGEPVSPGASNGFGLIGMSERAIMLDGTLTAGPAPTNGWRVHATLPRNDR